MEFGYNRDGSPKNNIWPNLMPKTDLINNTSVIFKQYLDSHYEFGYRRRMQYDLDNLYSAFEEPSLCYDVAGLFCIDELEEIADPTMAFQWYAYGHKECVIDEYSEIPYRMNMCQCLIAFGNHMQKMSALLVMDSFANLIQYADSPFNYNEIIDYISTCAGVHSIEVFRKSEYDLSSVKNPDRAKAVYLMLIQLMISTKHHAAKNTAERLEPILGVSYFDFFSKENTNVSTASGSSSNNNTKAGGCYIATCVYGSYDCPEVWALRRFRDNILAQSILGRIFIKAYYSISPRIVRLWGKNEVIRNIWKTPLDKLVSTLKVRGIEDTPYED